MGKPSPPQAPDPVRTAQAQTASNRETAITQTGLNAMDQTGPYGSVRYTQNGQWADGTPRFSQNTTLTPAQQTLLNTSQRTSQNVADIGERQSRTLDTVLGSQFNTDGLPAGGNAAALDRPGYQQFGNGPAMNTTGGDTSGIRRSLSTNDYSGDRQRVEDALMARLNPQIERDRAAQEASLANRGIRMGSTNYDVAQDQFGRNVNDARLGAILNAGQEQNRLQQLDLNAGTFQNNAQNQNYQQTSTNAGFGNAARQQMFQNQTGTTAANNALQDSEFANSRAIFDAQNTQRGQALNERLTTRNQAINENIGLATGSQVQMPQFGPTPQTGVGGTDVAGITQGAYNGQMAQYGQQMGQYNSTMGGLFGLGANALMAFSDERLKTDIEPTGESVGGVPVKSWTWKGTGQRETGVIAQELERKHPELVDNSHPSGFKRVNYGGLMRLGANAQRRAA
jgi:hypothetical protein